MNGAASLPRGRKRVQTADRPRPRNRSSHRGGSLSRPISRRACRSRRHSDRRVSELLSSSRRKPFRLPRAGAQVHSVLPVRRPRVLLAVTSPRP